jgi:lipoprotein-anchoring transpeptidase ErfK/SrfK
LSAHKQNSRNWWQFALGLGCFAALTGLAYLWLPLPSGETAADPSKPPPRPTQTTLELQIALARSGFSPGSIDGAMGLQTRQALTAYQRAHGLPPTSDGDEAHPSQLLIRDPVFAFIELTAADFRRIDAPPMSWRERGQRSRMAYHSILEMVAEKSQSDPDLIAELNPGIDWSALQPGTRIRVPHIPAFIPDHPAEHLRISLSERSLQAIDPTGRVIFHAPVSIARRVDKRPSGELKVAVRVEDPNYTFNPAILSGTAAREGITEKFIIQPGPNNPVGSIWIGLNLPSYGIHGTPEPEQVGRTESSGCFRLANWNAERLIHIVHDGMSVYVEP